MRSGTIQLLLVGGCLLANQRLQAADPPTPPAAGQTQWWKAVVEIPGMPLEYVVTFRADPRQAGAFSATMDIPAQGAVGVPLIDVVLTDADIAFTIGPPANAVHTLTRNPDGTSASGQLKQHGMSFPLAMTRITQDQARSVGPPRPQTPKPPFPYTQREVGYENPVDGPRLAGTLTIPQGPAPHPAALLITGSGAQDRDETIFGHKPFAVIADHLTRRGIAVLRVDDRGVGGSGSGNADPTSADFARDVEAGIDFLKQQPEIDPRRIALIGHSEGGIIGPLVASKRDDVTCLVLMAGTGIPGGQLLRRQNEAMFRAGGATSEQVGRMLTCYDEVLTQLAAGATADAVRPAVRSLVEAQLAAQPGTANTPEAQLEQLTEAGLLQFRSAWMRWFVSHDPAATLRAVRCPVLALNGTLDLQVPADENLIAIDSALRAGGNRDVTVKKIPGVNHLFQEAKLGTVAEYQMISQTISPQVLNILTDWLRPHLLEPSMPSSRGQP